MSFGYSERGGWYGGPLFWLLFGCIFLSVMVILAWVVAILVGLFIVGLGIWAVFEYRSQARAGLHRTSPDLGAEVELVSTGCASARRRKRRR